eukprot:COSAG01_NODE_70328_length_259_cov_0.512500_1_plen_69_part_00
MEVDADTTTENQADQAAAGETGPGETRHPATATAAGGRGGRAADEESPARLPPAAETAAAVAAAAVCP